MKTKQIDILLPVYNGERYLKEQLDSIFHQTYQNFQILVRDDGSSDDSRMVIEEYQQKHPNQIKIIRDQKGNLGVTLNNLELLWNSTANYVMFCDQDDVWMKNKIKGTFFLMKEMEKIGKKSPLLIHTDAIVTNAELSPLKKNATMNEFGYKKERTSFANLLLLNSVQGAACMINRALIDKLDILRDRPIPRRLVYDSLIASVASIYGGIYYEPRASLWYRQHENNVVGVRRTGLRHFFHFSEAERERFFNSHFLVVNRSKCDLLKRYYINELSESQKEILNYFKKEPGNIRKFIKLGLYKEFPIIDQIYMLVLGIR